MPVVSVRLWDVARLAGTQVELEALSTVLSNLKLEVEKVEADSLVYEAPHDRLDLYSAEGLTRAISYQLGIKKPVKYAVSKSSLYVDSSRAPSYRPHVLMTIVRDVKLDDEAISQIFQLQEKLHISHCGDRELVSIGLYDLDKLSFPVYYREVTSVVFRPLGYSRVMNITEILSETDKGREYRHLVKEGLYPLLVDSEDVVLSLPPIINSEDTRVTDKTKNVLIDVTGTEPTLMASILAVVTMAVYERGAKSIEVVPVVGGTAIEDLVFNMLTGRKISVKAGRVSELIGVEPDFREALRNLEKYGYIIESIEEDRAIVWVPPYRVDVIDEDDVIEDIAISLDYNRITGILEPPTHRGTPHLLETVSRYARDILIGLGFTEVVNFILTDPDYLAALRYTKFISIKNPKMRVYSALRPSLLPGVLRSLSKNVRRYGLQDLKVFEIGDTVDPGTLATFKAVSGAVYGPSTTLTDGLTAVRTFLETLGFKPQFKGVNGLELIIDERSAAVEVSGEFIGIVGEIHPKYLKYLELEAPVAVFEISISKLVELLVRSLRT
ncbi:MAG: phenylalanine--tRNA ligase subunit beta [Sulfolobales archaeon]|nr:phenylalanine--tRNA ligase subunit beta [Sulfolobales archaeon]MDW8083225.1 phenylalanine--tRNA ligase subunit beta [Sulfolobales archaeon]